MPSRQDDLDAKHVLARHAIADDPVSSGIGREISADRAGVARPKIEPKEKSGIFSCFLDDAERRACHAVTVAMTRSISSIPVMQVQRQRHAPTTSAGAPCKSREPSLRHRPAL